MGHAHMMSECMFLNRFTLYPCIATQTSSAVWLSLFLTPGADIPSECSPPHKGPYKWGLSSSHSATLAPRNTYLFLRPSSSCSPPPSASAPTIGKASSFCGWGIPVCHREAEQRLNGLRLLRLLLRVVIISRRHYRARLKGGPQVA